MLVLVIRGYRLRIPFRPRPGESPTCASAAPLKATRLQAHSRQPISDSFGVKVIKRLMSLV